METPLAVFFAALFLVALTLQIKIIVRALAAIRVHPDTHLPVNYLLLVVGVLTAVVAGGFAVLFGIVALRN